MAHKDGLCVSYFILACAIVISSGFSFWLYKDTDLIKYTDLVRDSRRLLFYQQYEDAEIGLDAGLVKGSHGRLTDTPDAGPVFISTEPAMLDRDTLHATEVKDVVLRHLFDA